MGGAVGTLWMSLGLFYSTTAGSTLGLLILLQTSISPSSSHVCANSNLRKIHGPLILTMALISGLNLIGILLYSISPCVFSGLVRFHSNYFFSFWAWSVNSWLSRSRSQEGKNGRGVFIGHIHSLTLSFSVYSLVCYHQSPQYRGFFALLSPEQSLAVCRRKNRGGV